MDMNEVKIVSNNTITEIFLNGTKLEYVSGISFNHKAGEFPTVNIELPTDKTEIFIDKARIEKKEGIKKTPSK